MKKFVVGVATALAAGSVFAQTFIGASLTTNKVNIDCAGTVGVLRLRSASRCAPRHCFAQDDIDDSLLR